MTKVEFIEKITERSGLTKKDAQAFLKAFEDTMMYDVFAVNEKVTLSIGSFQGVDKPARKVRNPRTGEERMSEPKTGFPKYKPSRAAKE